MFSVVNSTKVGYGEHAFEYLSRYLYRGVLADKDIICITDDTMGTTAESRRKKGCSFVCLLAAGDGMHGVGHAIELAERQDDNRDNSDNE